MAKGFGIAALIAALIAFGVPLFGLYVSWLALALAVVAALAGDRIFATATPIVAAINTFLFSPMAWALFAGEATANGSVFLSVTILLMLAPFAAIILNATCKVVLGSAGGGPASG